MLFNNKMFLSNVATIQRSQSKILRTIVNAPWFVSKHTLHTDLNIPYVSEVINEKIDKHLNKLEFHPNQLVETLTQPMRNKRLKNVGPPIFTTEVTSLDGHPTKTT
jgi:hypothetical protein